MISPCVHGKRLLIVSPSIKSPGSTGMNFSQSRQLGIFIYSNIILDHFRINANGKQGLV